jgi:hypothetical protein
MENCIVDMGVSDSIVPAVVDIDTLHIQYSIPGFALTLIVVNIIETVRGYLAVTRRWPQYSCRSYDLLRQSRMTTGTMSSH